MASRKHKQRPAAKDAPVPANAPADEPEECVVLPYDVHFEYALDCQLITDTRGLILNVNHAGLRFLHSEKMVLIGKPLGLLFRNDRPNLFYDRLARISFGMATCSFETRLTDSADRVRDVLVMGAVASPKTIRWLIHDTTPWKRAEIARVELVRKLITVQDEERRKLARDLHDDVGQLLTGLSLALGAIENDASLSTNAKHAMDLARQVAKDLRRSVHDICHGLRGGLLDDVGLFAALDQLVAEWRTREPEMHLEFLGETIQSARMPREIEAIVYSIVQEGLTNVFRHAHAHRASVIVECDQRCLTMILRDDGAGFDMDLAAHQTSLGRLGLVGIRERAALVGGELSIDTAPGEGTVIVVRIPVPLNKK